MVTTLYLIRHGETEGDGVKRYYGSIDVLLSERGIEQIKKTSNFVVEHLRTSSSSKYSSYLRDLDMPKEELREPGEIAGIEQSKLSAVYCSDLGRAIKSAEIIAAPHGLRAVVVPALRERSFGIWEGMTFAEIKEKYPAEFEAWADNPVEFSPVEGESTSDVWGRVIPELERIMKKHEGEHVAAVAHGGINRIILCHILGIPLENIFRIEQDHGAVNIIEFWDRYPVVKLVNFRPG